MKYILFYFNYSTFSFFLFSFHRISSGEPSRPIPVNESVNLSAGAELLLRYQTEWHDGHQLAEENAAKAQVMSCNELSVTNSI